MTLEIQKIAEGQDGEAIHRRRHVKSDGREVLLYGYAPPDYAPIYDGLHAEPTASELRWHPFREEWAIYAAGRQNRTYKPANADDPLAPSRAGAPPTEIPFPDFEIAVFENRFPSLTLNSTPRHGTAPASVESAPATGRCEVVVYTPETSGSLATLPEARRRLLVHAWIDRYDALFSAGCKFVLPFENRGDEVGVTLHHPHGQIYGFSFIPLIHQKTAEAFKSGFNLENCIRHWRDDYEIASRDGMSAFAPPFARFPYEIWIAPTQKRRGPWEFSETEIESFAALLGDVTRRYDSFFSRPCPYMLSLHAAPEGAGDSFHFTAQFYPLLRAANRIKYLASVEQATNVFTVDALPEEAARALRIL